MPKRGLIDRIPNVNVLPAVREHGVLQPTPEQISVYSLWHRFHLPQHFIDRLMDLVRPEVVSNSLAPTYTYSTVVRNAEGLHQMRARV